MKELILTIAIPTFNRVASLRLTLMALMPQITDECELLILDNHTTDETSGFLESILHSYSGVAKLKIIRHAANVGGNENILRCIEYAGGSYVWLLGDDDTPHPTAIETILMKINTNPNTLVFNFYLSCAAHQARDRSHKTVGSINYLKHTKSLGELVFISNIVLCVKHALQNLNEAHLWQSSHVPQLIVSTIMLRGSGEAIFSDKTVVVRQLSSEINAAHGSILPIATGIGSILYPRWTSEEVNAIRKLELWFSVYTVINQMVILASKGREEARQAENYRRNILSTLTLRPFNKFQRSLLFLSQMAIKYPKLSIYLKNLIFKMLKKDKKENKINLDFNR